MYADEAIENAWMRARSRCECGRSGHPEHRGRCEAVLSWTARGDPEQGGAWEAIQRGGAQLGGWQAVDLTEILCWACYRRAISSQPLTGTRGSGYPQDADMSGKAGRGAKLTSSQFPTGSPPPDAT
jgi:hypothetical protein